MICGRCDRSIHKDEPYSVHDMPSPTGPGTTVYRHVDPCKKVPTQTSQVSLRH